MSGTVLKVANCSGFFGDRQSAAREMVQVPDLDVLTGDWLAELTMLILRKQQARNPLKGFASTFVAQLEEVLGTCVDRGIKIVSNAGGLNPGGCAEAVQAVASKLGIDIKVGTVSGDNILDRVPDLLAADQLRALDGSPLKLKGDALAANAYLGGWGITACLEAGADVVVTGRVSDAALVVGPAAWAHGWKPDECDKIAGAIVAGHIIECGAQATGGNFPFFRELGTLTRLGFPIAEIAPDGSSVITKPERTNGAVNVDTVTAQLLYEIQSTTYHNADASVLLGSLSLEQVAQDRVRVSGVRGTHPPETLKVSMSVPGGWRNAMSLVLTGPDASEKARVAENCIWDLVPGGRETFSDTSVELIGTPAEDPATLGAAATILRLAVASDDETVAGRQFSSAVVQTGLASYPGFYLTTPPGPATSYATFIPALVESSVLATEAAVNGIRLDVLSPKGRSIDLLEEASGMDSSSSVDWSMTPMTRRALGEVCGARSGDKGGNANVGLWTRDDLAWDWLRTTMTTEAFAALLPDGQSFHIERCELANLRALNFVIHGWLGDGVSSSLRLDSQAKGLAEFVRARYVDVPLSFFGQGT